MKIFFATRAFYVFKVVLGLEVLAQLLVRIGRGELDGCFHQNLVILMLLSLL